MIRNATLSLGAAALLALPLAHAQYEGPGQRPVLNTVGLVLSQGKDDQQVTLRGRLIRQIDEDTYRFTDGSGEIDVEIDDDDFPNAQIGEQTEIEIVGEIDTRRLRDPEIDADQVRILTP
jgi:uncharacterized protein (TIGR00156 family)